MPSQSDSSSNPPVRLRDIAERLGVSTMTVSLALRSHPSISKKRIAQVLRTADEMGYRPNAMASALAHRRWTQSPRSMAGTLAWLNCWDSPGELRKHPAFDLYWKGAASAADALGYRLEEFVHRAGMSHKRLEQVLLTRNIQGIVVPPHPVSPDLKGFDVSQFSIVRIGHSIGNLPVDLISTDQVRGGIEAFNRVWGHGYRRIGLVLSQWVELNTLFRAGFLLACSKRGVRRSLPTLELRDVGEVSAVDDLHRLKKWVELHRPDAILTDVRGMEGMLAELNHRVPDRVALAMLGGATEKVAGIVQNSEEVGRMASEILIALIQRGIRGVPAAYRVHLASPSWVGGASLPERSGH